MKGACFRKRAPVMCPGLWCPLLRHGAARILSLLHVEHASKQCVGHSECACGARVTCVCVLVAAMRRTVTENGAFGTRPDPMTGNRSLANVVEPPPFWRIGMRTALGSCSGFLLEHAAGVPLPLLGLYTAHDRHMDVARVFVHACAVSMWLHSSVLGAPCEVSWLSGRRSMVFCSVLPTLDPQLGLALLSA